VYLVNSVSWLKINSQVWKVTVELNVEVLGLLTKLCAYTRIKYRIGSSSARIAKSTGPFSSRIAKLTMPSSTRDIAISLKVFYPHIAHIIEKIKRLPFSISQLL